MQHLSSKVLVALVACSATVLLSGVNVHASAGQHQRPRTLKQSRVVQPASSQIRTQSFQPTDHYTYRNLMTVKNHQTAPLRLSARRGRRAVRRPNKFVKRNHRRTNVKHRNNRGRRVNKRITRRRGKRTRSVRRSRRSGRRSARRIRKFRGRKRKQRRAKRVGQKAPKLVTLPRRRITTQKKSAVNRFSKNIKYVENSKPGNFLSSGQYGDSDYGRVGTPITGDLSNGQITFHRLTFIPKKLRNNQFYSPQGLVIVGHYAYVITNATNSYESSHSHDSDRNRQAPASYIDGDDSTGSSPYGLGASQIIRIDLNRNVKDYNNNLRAARRNIKVGPVFYGGHGQGLAYNPKTRQLWLLDNKAGQVTKTAVSLINLRTLAPQSRINFHFGDTTIGDDLTFDRKGKAVNVTEAGTDSFATPGAVKVFTGTINPRGVHMSLVKQALRWGPSSVIQGLTYNPRNNRAYILGDDSVTSFPIAGLGHLKKTDVWNTPFNTSREFEGLSFDRAGNAYLLVSRSPEILKANYNQNF